MIRNKETIRLFAKDITGDVVKDRQEVVVNLRTGQLIMDEPFFNGGKDIGPDPFSAVLSGLVACTLTTLRMYIKEKGGIFLIFMSQLICSKAGIHSGPRYIVPYFLASPSVSSKENVCYTSLKIARLQDYCKERF